MNPTSVGDQRQAAFAAAVINVWFSTYSEAFRQAHRLSFDGCERETIAPHFKLSLGSDGQVSHWIDAVVHGSKSDVPQDITQGIPGELERVLVIQGGP